MKKTVLTAAVSAALTLTACTANEPSPKAGMANPASEFCLKQGGKPEILKDKDGGEYGVCRHGREVEKWDYFRKNRP